MTRSRVETVAWAVALWLLATFPAWWRPSLVTAWSAGEADNHLWMLWQASHSGGPWANAPVGTGLPLLDPTNLPWFAVGFAASPAVAWNLGWMVAVAVALAGGYALGREATGDVVGGRIGMVVLGASPFLHGMGVFGLTEDWGLGWLALYVAGLGAYARSGRASAGAGASASLAAYALFGWYAALFAAIVTPFALWAWGYSNAARCGNRIGTSRGVVAIGAVAVVAVLPSAVATWHARGAWASRLGDAVPMAFDPGWRDIPSGGADLLTLFLPHPDAVASGRSVYLGLGVLVLAGLGARRAWAAGAVTFGGLALGTWLRVGGHRLVPLPVDLVAGILPIHHWYRAVGPLTVMLVPMVALGASRWPRMHRAIAAFIVLDLLISAGIPWPRPQYDPRPPDALVASRGAGAMVLLPFDNGRTPFSQEAPRTFDRWGPWLERPLAENYEGPDALLLDNRLVAAADRACGVPSTVAWAASAAFATLDDADVARGAIVGLHHAHVDRIVLLSGRAASPEAARAVLTRWLGAPIVDRDGVVAFAVP